MEKLYHIYINKTCVFHSVKEEEFKITWDTLYRMVGLIETNYTEDDLSYEEVIVNKDMALEASY